MAPNIVPGWPPQRGQRIDQGLFHTYSIGPAAGGPGSGTPGIGNPQMVDPQQRKMLIPPGGGVGGGGGPGPGSGGGLPGGELFGGMGGPLFGGLGHATGAMLPGIGMAQGGVTWSPLSEASVPMAGMGQMTALAKEPSAHLQPGGRPADSGASLFYQPISVTPADLPINQPDADGWTTFAQGTMLTRTAGQVKSLTDEEKSWFNSNFGELFLAIADTDSATTDPQYRKGLRNLKELLDRIKRGGGLWWGRGGSFGDGGETQTMGQAVGVKNVILINWAFGDPRPAPCTARYVVLLAVLVNELFTSAVRPDGSHAEAELASNRASRAVLAGLKEALKQAKQSPSSPGTSRIREWIASHPPCNLSTADGRQNLDEAIDAASRAIRASDDLEGH